MKLEVGDLVVIRDECKFKEAIDSFHEKWRISSAPTAKAMGMVTGMATSMTTVTVTVRSTERQTGKSILLKYYGYKFKPFDQIVGVVTKVIVEDHSDFDVIKIREQSGGVRYCRRYILERAQEAI